MNQLFGLQHRKGVGSGVHSVSAINEKTTRQLLVANRLQR